jgi:hypothetical protein
MTHDKKQHHHARTVCFPGVVKFYQDPTRLEREIVIFFRSGELLTRQQQNFLNCWFQQTNFPALLRVFFSLAASLQAPDRKEGVQLPRASAAAHTRFCSQFVVSHTKKWTWGSGNLSDEISNSLKCTLLENLNCWRVNRIFFWTVENKSELLKSTGFSTTTKNHAVCADFVLECVLGCFKTFWAIKKVSTYRGVRQHFSDLGHLGLGSKNNFFYRSQIAQKVQKSRS